jgi:hypothetical protein
MNNKEGSGKNPAHDNPGFDPKGKVEEVCAEEIPDPIQKGTRRLFEEIEMGILKGQSRSSFDLSQMKSVNVLLTRFTT